MDRSDLKNAPGHLARALKDNGGVLAAFLVLFVLVSALVPNFLTRVNFIGLALSVSLVGMLSSTMLFCLAAGDFDLSVESVVAFSGVLAAVVVNATGSVALGIAAGILAGGVVGLANGAVISLVGINALITTLATMQIVRGLGFIVSDGKAVGVAREGFFFLGNSSSWASRLPSGSPPPASLLSGSSSTRRPTAGGPLP